MTMHEFITLHSVCNKETNGWNAIFWGSGGLKLTNFPLRANHGGLSQRPWTKLNYSQKHFVNLTGLHAGRLNLTKPTFTCKLCTWNVPSGSKFDMVPKRIKDICFDKAHYMKEGNSKNKVTASKRKFLAFRNCKKIIKNSQYMPSTS